MTDRVNPAMKDMEPAPLHAVVDRPRPKTQRQELSPADDAILPLRQPSDRLIRSAFTPYVGVNCTLARHDTDGAALNAAVQPSTAPKSRQSR